MSTAIYVPTGFSWVAASLLSTVVLLHWQAGVVGKGRVKARIPYPQMYAEKAEQDASRDALIFNCKQRAHQNTLENTPTIILTTLISAVQYPKYAAVACGLWNLGRVLYTLGYATGEPKKRSRGNIPSYLAALGLVGLSGKTVYDLFKAGV